MKISDEQGLMCTGNMANYECDAGGVNRRLVSFYRSLQYYESKVLHDTEVNGRYLKESPGSLGWSMISWNVVDPIAMLLLTLSKLKL